MDCTDNKNNTIIIYAAFLKIAGLKIPFCSYLINNGEITIEESRLKKAKLFGSDNLEINIPSLKTEGHWHKADSGISEVLFKSGRKRIIWDCHQPKSKVALKIGNNTFEGLGYAETIHLSFSPIQLPIDTLLWGRYLSTGFTIVWIEWKGPYPQKKVYVNGIIQTGAIIENEKISFPELGMELLLSDARSIKNNPLSALAKQYPFLKLFFSKHFLSSHEIKYSGMGTIIKDKNILDTGRALYETVQWKR
ncbi:MAG: hypothetical protein QM594_14905 [Niabella sp.]